MSITRASLKLTFVRTGGVLLSFFAMAYFAGEIGPEGVGVFFLFQAVVSLLHVLMDLGTREAIEKRISERTEPRRYLGAGIVLKTIIVIVVSCLVYLLSGEISAYVGTDVTNLVAPALIFGAAARSCRSVLRGELRVGETAVLQASQQMSFVAASLLLVAFGWGARGLIFGYILSFIVESLVGVSKISIRPKSPQADHIWSLFNYAKYNFVTMLGGYAYENVDILVLGWLLGQSAVGIYELAWRITNVFLLLGRTVGDAIFPEVSSTADDEVQEAVETLFPNALVASLFFIVPGFFGSLVLSREILSVVYGPEFGAGYLIFVILMGEKILQSVHTIVGKFLHGLGRPDIGAQVAVVSVSLNAVLNFVLIPLFGIEGAALSTTFSFGVNTVVTWILLSELVDIWIPGRTLAGIVVGSNVMMAVVYVIAQFVNVNTVFSLLGIVGLGAVVYFATVMTLPELRRDIESAYRDLSA